MRGVDIILQEWIDKLLTSFGLSVNTANAFDRWIILIIIVLVAAAVDFLIRQLLLRLVKQIVARTRATWDDIIFDSNVLKRLSNIITPILIYVMLPIAFSSHDGSGDRMHIFLARGVEIYLVLAFVRFVNAFLKATFELAEQKPSWHGRPIKGLMQTGQVITFCIAVILIISILINKSPVILLTGLGAGAAILSLIFKDSILGLVAGVQLSANNMLKVGDWISMPARGVDGVVEEVALTTVKVRGWDNTLQMLPPYLLISESFDNWQAMRDSGGRRIKRSLNFDMSSVTFASEALVTSLRSDQLLQPLMEAVESQSPEGTPLTNMDLYIRYMILYLKQHARVNQQMIILVRQLQPLQWGLPVEFYCFSADVNWIPYEGLQSEVISHAVALAPKFGLRIYQAPMSQDLNASENE